MERGNMMRVEKALPEAVIIDVFAKLPVKSLIRFMCLSKSYSQAISDPQFFSLHLHHSNQINKQFLLHIRERPLTLQSVSFCHDQLLRQLVTLEPRIPSLELLSRLPWEIVGSCNGVLCLKNSGSRHDLGILNPSIQRFKLVPFPPLEDSFYFDNVDPNCIYSSVNGRRRSFSIEIGFGFDSCTSDFKIVIIFQDSYSGILRKVQVYSLRKNSWKVVSNVPNVSCDLDEPEGVFNGAFYWVEEPHVGGQSLLMFDFTDETFKEINLPDCFFGNLDSPYEVDGMGEVKGKLSLLLHCEAYSSEGIQLELWMMEDSVWVRQFVFNVEWFSFDMCLGMNDDLVLLMTHFGEILSCDLKTMKVTDHGVEKQARRAFTPPAFTYTPSLALLGEEN